MTLVTQLAEVKARRDANRALEKKYRKLKENFLLQQLSSEVTLTTLTTLIILPCSDFLHTVVFDNICL